MSLIFIIAVAVYLVTASFLYMQSKKRIEAESLAQVTETMAHSQAMKDAMNMLTDVSHLTTASICRLRADQQDYYSGIKSQIHVRLEILDFSFCNTLFQQIEQLEEVVKITPGVDWQKEIKIRQNRITETYDVMRDVLLGNKEHVSYLFRGLRGDIKRSDDGNIGVIESAIFLEESAQDCRKIFLEILAEKGPTTFSNCKVDSLDESSLTLKFHPE